MASCFYSKADKRGTAGTRVEDGKVRKLATILNVKTDRRGHSHRNEQIHHVGTETRSTQHSLGRSKSVAEESTLRPFSSLADHIYSTSHRFPSSNHSNRASEITEVSTDGWAPEKDDSWKKKFQGGSFRKLVSRRAIDDVHTEPAPDDKQQHNLESGPSQVSSRYLALLSAPVGVNNLPEIRAIKSGAPKSPHRNLPVPKKGTDSPKDPSDILAQKQVKESPGCFEITLLNCESDFSVRTDSVLQATSGLLNHSGAPMFTKGEEAVDEDDGTVPSEPKSDWERVLDRTIAHMTDSPALTSEIEEEEEDADKDDDHEVAEPALANSQPVDNRPDLHHSKRSITETGDANPDGNAVEAKADKRDAQWATISQRVALWLGRTRAPGHSKTPAPEKADKREEIVQFAPISHLLPVRWPTKPIPVDSNTTPQSENFEEETLAHDDDEKGIDTPVKSVPNSPPVLDLETKLPDVDHHNGVSSDAPPWKIDDSGDEIVITPLMPNSQPDTLPDAAPRLSTVSDNEAVARLWEQLDMVDGEEKTPAGRKQPQAAEDKPVATGKKPKGAAAGSTRRRRRVRFSTCGGSDEFSVVDISATLLGKLSATKHHQVRYLQDTLEQTRAQVAQLEHDFQAQRDLKVAFKVQAVRLGSALKKLREFAQENGLDPRGVEASFSLGTPTRQLESDEKTKEIDDSPEMIALKTQATEFGWLCDAKEVELREQIGSGSTADIFKGVWHNLDVAVKCLRPDVFGENPDVIAEFCKEVELLSRQRHPYILRMFAACLSPPDNAWIITEYTASGTLTEWLHGTKTRERNRIVPLPPLSERLRIATEISMAMQYLHELSPKILHRDLKPSNILLDENNHVRIADFNCARYFTSKDAAVTGETGTYVYMAPEVMAHESYNEKCDIYSFAVILCELLTGTPPYADTTYSPAEIACKVAQGGLRPTLPESQPEMLVELIKDAWEHKPRKRPSFSGITATLMVITGEFLDFLEPSLDDDAEIQLHN